MAMFLGVFGVFGLAGQANAEEPSRDSQWLDRVCALRKQLTEFEALGRARVLKERGLRPAARPPVTTAANVEDFAPVTARFVRFTVGATVNGAEPCLHTLEVNGPDSPVNLALAEGVRLTASSVMPDFRSHFKDGKYAPLSWCWVSAERGKGWLRVELPAPAKINRLMWSRDAANRHHDRVPTAYQVEVSEDGRGWRTVATSEDRELAGRDYWVSREASVKALDVDQQSRYAGVLAMLRKLGGARPIEVKSGPQVGEGVPGAFAALFLSGVPKHVGKQRCPV
jgi:hypothetical protein